MSLINLRENAFDRVQREMKLRRPQREALKSFHDIHKILPATLSKCNNDLIVALFRECFPSWYFEGPCPEITFQLATGVGKTRLIGALMAYLYLAQESSHFVIVTPRSEIVRKFLRESRPSHSKYIFYDQSLVEEPEIIHADNIDSFEPSQTRLLRGPVIWIITPQALTAPGARFKRKDEHSEVSPNDYLRSLSDLVVFFDESHHLGNDQDKPSVWRNEVRKLEPKYLLGTTASVDPSAHNNVIYQYELCECLNDRLYTKMVRVIAEKKDTGISSEEHDRIVLRYGLEQLDLKQAYLDEHFTNGSEAKKPQRVKAVILVCCREQDHAEEISEWLKEYLDQPESVLLVHSKLSSSKYLELLLGIEEYDNPVRVVVSVTMLTEGWDVSNVYVVAPLRAMASSTIITQVMGRGLRLPFGKLTNINEMDTLDVLCFGKESMQEICDKMIRQGFGVNSGGGVLVKPAPSGNQPPTKHSPSKKYKLICVRGPKELRMPHLRLGRAALDLGSVIMPGLDETSIHAFRIHDPRTIEILGNRTAFARDYFIDIVVTGLLKSCKYLSHQIHSQMLTPLVDRFLNSSAQVEAEVKLEPEKVIYHIKDKLDDLNRKIKAQYEKIGSEEVIDLKNIEILVPESFSIPIDSAMIDKNKWQSNSYGRIPLSGWSRCVFEAMPFDQPNELKVGKILDRSAEVTWWFRNLPSILSLATPAGYYAPDFAILLRIKQQTVLLEIKGDIFQEGVDAEANLKKKAAISWCLAMTEATKSKWSYWFLLDSDADLCSNFEELSNYAEKSSG